LHNNGNVLVFFFFGKQKFLVETIHIATGRKGLSLERKYHLRCTAEEENHALLLLNVTYYFNCCSLFIKCFVKQVKHIDIV
jgi:hypothetical protein